MKLRWVLGVIVIAAIAAPHARAATGLPVDVTGGTSGARKIASRAARSWTGDPRADSMDGLVSTIGSALVSEGWGSGTVEASIDSSSGVARLKIALHEVEPTRLSAWYWDPPGRFPSVEPGAWDPLRAQERMDALLEEVTDTGRSFASIQIIDVADSAQGLVVRARLQEGAMLHLAAPVFEGSGTTKASYIERVSGLRRGDPIRPREARAARDRIERTGLFTHVAGPWLRVLQEDQANLVYRLTPAPQNRADGAIGYDGSKQSLSGFVHVELGNLFGTGRRLDALWDHYQKDRSSLSLAYREPFLGGLPISSDLGVSQRLEDTTWTADEARIALAGDLGGGLRARVGLAAHRTIQSGDPSVRVSRLDTIVGIALDRRRDMGTAGSAIDVEVSRGTLERTPSLDAGEGTLVKLMARGEENWTFGRRGLLRMELLGGVADGPDSLPRPDAVRLGGAATLRGYPEEAFTTLSCAIMRLEAGVRLLPEGNRLYVFTDRALYRPWPAGEREWASSYGFGLRVRGANGWIRLDYGVPTGSGPLSGRIHFRLETRF